MKKTLIALAVAGVIAAPAAMAEVTVYGIAHVSLDNVTGDPGLVAETVGEQSLAVTNRASRVGVKAAEDLGDGLKAVAQMEFQIDMTGDKATGVTKGDNNLTARNQIVGLAGSFGTVVVGRHDTPYKMSTGSLDVFSDTAADYNAVIGTPAGLELRGNDVLAYLSPDMSGFSVQAAIVAASADGADADADDDDMADATSIAVQYKAGPLFVAAATESFAADDTATGTRLGVGYDAGVAKVGFVYETVSDAGNVAGDDYTAMLVNAAIPMGSNTIIAEYGMGTLDSGTAGVADEDTTIMAVGVSHGFSKTTSAYVAYGSVAFDDGAATDIDANVLTAGMVVKF